MIVTLYLCLLYLTLLKFVITPNTMYKVYSFILFSLLLFLSFFIFRVELLTYFFMIIYMGAIMVLFLFVIMLIEFKPLKYYPLKVQIINVSLVFIMFSIFLAYYKEYSVDTVMNFSTILNSDPELLQSEKSNLFDLNETIEVGIVFYEYFFYFILLLTNIFLLGILSVVLITKSRTTVFKEAKKTYKIYY